MLESGDFEAGERDASQWMSIMKLETKSSDESGMDDEEEVIMVHALPWLSEAVKDLKSLLDQRIVAANQTSNEAADDRKKFQSKSLRRFAHLGIE